MGYFPFFVDIEDKCGLIVGGGKVAAHKINKLLEFNPRLKVVAPEILPSITALAVNDKRIECHLRNFIEADLEGVHFVIAASDNRDVNARISCLCREKNILVNAVDDKKNCSFIFPSLIKKGDLTVGISTSGASPEIAANIKCRMAGLIPSDIDKILDYLSKIRDIAKENIKDDEIRAKFLKDTAKECMAENAVFSREETLERIKAYINGKNTDNKGRIVLVGAGCGGFDLITLKGMQAVRNAQVLVYDDLIDDRLLEFTPESCEKIYVGKRSGRHSMKQDKISMILVEKALEGKYVVRLKGGDPFVFGRATEEIEALKAHDISCGYIPGITSSIAVPGLAGIPVTSRNLSRSFHVITGHTAKTHDTLPNDLEKLAVLDGTLIFLMGIENLKSIADGLIANGKPKDTPAAVIHGNTDNSADIIKATLSEIADRVVEDGIKTPAIIVVGPVVDLS